MYINKELRHGHRTTYIKHLCRCVDCKKANSEYLKKYRRKGTPETQYEYQKVARGALDWVINNRPDIYKQLTRGLQDG